MASLLGTSTGATEARVWLLLGGVLSPAAAWPQDLKPASSLPMVGQELPEMPGDAYPVRHQGDVLGAFTLAMPSNDPMNPAKARVVDDLAAQTGLVLRNVRLLEESSEHRAAGSSRRKMSARRSSSATSTTERSSSSSRSP
jgi:K+-sensing histidine kinase KdpD